MTRSQRADAAAHFFYRQGGTGADEAAAEQEAYAEEPEQVSASLTTHLSRAHANTHPFPQNGYADESAEEAQAAVPAAVNGGAASSAVETWSVTMLDGKKKKKKGTLGVGNGSLFFASESDKVGRLAHRIAPDRFSQADA